MSISKFKIAINWWHRQSPERKILIMKWVRHEFGGNLKSKMSLDDTYEMYLRYPAEFIESQRQSQLAKAEGRRGAA